MNSLAYLLYSLGYSLQGVLIWRALRCATWRFYPFFSLYFFYTCVSGVAQFLLASLQYPGYANLYWWTEVVAAVLRFALGWELFRQVFRRDSAVRTIAGTILVGALTALALMFWASGPSPGTSFVIDFMRKMALAVATWIVVVIGLARFYAIPIGRNISGMAIGFLIFAASEIANFAAFDLSPGFGPIWRFVHPFSYLCMLAVWVWSLWNYAPNPELRSTEASIGPQALSHWKEQSAALNKIIRKVINP